MPWINHNACEILGIKKLKRPKLNSSQPERENEEIIQKGSVQIFKNECLNFLTTNLQEYEGTIPFIYIDPPFNTGKTQKRARNELAYHDSYEDFIEFLRPRLELARRFLKSNGSLFFHIDYREAHYCKILLDEIFGRECFMNEIIWAYDYGGRSKKRWSQKHDTLFWYVKDPKNYTFNYEEIDRIPYMAPGLVGKEKAARGKTPTACWWHTIVPTNGKEKTGYPTQKPLGVLNRIIKVHTNPGDIVLDFFAGSGTTGEACASLGRNALLVDENPQAIEIMEKRLADYINS